MSIKELDKIVYWVSPEGEIEQGTFRSLVEQYIDETTTPRGVAPRYHRRGREIWSWGPGGNFPHRAAIFDSEEEAEIGLWANHIYDYETAHDSPIAYDTIEEARHERALWEAEEEET